jgi:hypothetical protein
MSDNPRDTVAQRNDRKTTLLLLAMVTAEAVLRIPPVQLLARETARPPHLELPEMTISENRRNFSRLKTKSVTDSVDQGLRILATYLFEEPLMLLAAPPSTIRTRHTAKARLAVGYCRPSNTARPALPYADQLEPRSGPRVVEGAQTSRACSYSSSPASRSATRTCSSDFGSPGRSRH